MIKERRAVPDEEMSKEDIRNAKLIGILMEILQLLAAGKKFLPY